jgi:hypothetical protein
VTATLASTYGEHGKLVFSGPNKWALIATGGVAATCGALYLIYNFITLRSVQKMHDKEYGPRKAGERGEGVCYDSGYEAAKS